MSAVALHHTAAGPADAPAVVLLPSLGATLASFDVLVEPLVEAGLRVIRVDARGHGGSPVPEGPYALTDLAADVEALLDVLALERAHLLGISVGGATALQLALGAPERVDRLVLACTAARFGEPGPWRERAATVRAQGTAAIAEAVAARWIPPADAAARPDLHASLVAMIAATPPEGYASCCDAIAAADLRAELGRVEAPTLVLGGEEDPATPPDLQRELAHGIPGARLELLEGAAHLAHLTRPERFAALAAEHLTA